MSTMTLIQRNGSAEGVNPWLKTTVQEFFQGVNWENRVQPPSSPLPKPQPQPSSPAAAPLAATPASLDLTLSVTQFFEAIAWEGIPRIGASPSKDASPPSPSAQPETSETLDDFFGSF